MDDVRILPIEFQICEKMERWNMNLSIDTARLFVARHMMICFFN